LNLIRNWLESAGIADIALMLMVLEAIVLPWWRRRTGNGPEVFDLLWNLASGGCLLLALRAALLKAGWPWIALALLAALAAHLADLRRRWR
jgi:hypothetical protein